jgi:hypothetical protein
MQWRVNFFTQQPLKSRRQIHFSAQALRPPILDSTRLANFFHFRWNKIR